MGLLYDLIFGVFILTALAATLGNFLDKKFYTSPFLAIAFGILAIILGLARLVIKSNQIYKEGTEKNNAKK